MRGFEPPTPWSVAKCSVQLSYTHTFWLSEIHSNTENGKSQQGKSAHSTYRKSAHATYGKSSHATSCYLVNYDLLNYDLLNRTPPRRHFNPRSPRGERQTEFGTINSRYSRPHSIGRKSTRFCSGTLRASIALSDDQSIVSIKFLTFLT